MKTPPEGWPRISSSIFYDDARAAIDWLCAAFGFEARMVVEGEGGRIEHSQLVYGDGLIMVSQTGRRDFAVSPKGGGNTQSLLVFVDDVDAHCEHARKSGAEIATEPENQDYGEDYWVDRSYEAIDLEGHHWWFNQRVRG